MILTAGQQMAEQANANNNKQTFGPILVNVKAYGAKGDYNINLGIGTDDTVAIQKTIDAVYAGGIGGIVYLPPGTYKISSPLVFDQTTRTESNNPNRPNFIGGGSQFTIIYYTGTDTSFKLIGGTSGEGHHSSQTIQGIYFRGIKANNPTGLHIQNAAYLQMIDIKISAFDLGLSLQDVETARFESVISRFNKRGILAQQNPTPLAVSTRPNILTFVACQFGSNNEYGGYFIGGSCIKFIGGSVEGNGLIGVNPSKWGLKFEDSGFQGGVGCSLDTVYFENNKGDAHLIVSSTVASFVDINPVSHLVQGCTFNQVSNVNYVEHSIIASFSDSGGKQILNVIGCGFKRFNTYVASATRKNIYFDGKPMSNETITLSGNMFHDDIEGITPQAFATLDNLLPDGNCQVARWKDATLSGTKQYGKADMYMGYGTVITAGTLTQDAASPIGISKTAVKAAGVTTSGATGDVSIVTRFEGSTARMLKNKLATFSCKVIHDLPTFINCTIIVRVANALNDFSATTVIATAPDNTVFAVEERLFFNSVPMLDCSNGIEFEVKFKCGTVTNQNFWATDFQVIEGDIAKEIDRQPYSDALVNCNRYFYTTFADGVSPVQNSNSTLGCVGYAVQIAGTTGAWTHNFRMPVPMVKIPVITTYNPRAANSKWYNSILAADSGTPTVVHIANSSCNIVNTPVAGDALGNTVLVHVTADARL